MPSSRVVYVIFQGYYVTCENPSRQIFSSRSITEPPGPLKFTIGEEQTIPGLEEAVSSIQEGENAKCIEVPPEKAFGLGGNAHGFHGSGSPIPAKATLIFDQLEIVDEEKSGQTPAVLKQLGNDYFRSKEWGKALLKYKRALRDLKASGGLEKDKDLSVQCLSNQAACLLNLEKYKAAIEACDQVLDELKCQDNAKVLYRKARALVATKEYSAAISELDRALKIEPEDKAIASLKKKAKAMIIKEEQKQKQLFGGMFEKLQTDAAGGLYESTAPPGPTMTKCNICSEEVEEIQLARHIIKKHSEKSD